MLIPQMATIPREVVPICRLLLQTITPPLLPPGRRRSPPSSSLEKKKPSSSPGEEERRRQETEAEKQRQEAEKQRQETEKQKQEAEGEEEKEGEGEEDKLNFKIYDDNQKRIWKNIEKHPILFENTGRRGKTGYSCWFDSVLMAAIYNPSMRKIILYEDVILKERENLLLIQAY